MVGRRFAIVWAALAVALAFGCAPREEPSGTDAGLPDAGPDGGDSRSDDDLADDDAGDDAGDLPVVPGIAARPSILPPSVESCALIDQERCAGGSVRRCAIYDAASGGFPAEPPKFADRAFHQDRYGDLYATAGFSALTYHAAAYVAPGTPEAEWAAPENFAAYEDHGDGAFYMGYRLFAAAHRYAATGTDADYARMRAILEALLGNWRVTGVPGYMIRSAFAMLDPGVPVPPGHPEYNLHSYQERGNHVLYTVTGADELAWLPDYYSGGVTIGGTDYATAPTLEGSPSLDAYSGALLGLDFAFDLLRPEDQALRDEIATDVTCFVNRLRKMRVTNLRGSLLGGLLVAYFGGSGTLRLDPDDLDLSAIDTMVAYVAEAIPPGAPGDFRFDCPDGPPRDVDPDYDWDAGGAGFAFLVADFAERMQGLGPRPIDFAYFVSHRGGDVGYMIHWALLAYHVSGDPRYLDFIRRDLVGEVDGLAVLNTLGSFSLPPYCGQWIGGDLIHPILHAALRHLDGGPVADAIRRAMKEELRDKLLANDGNAYFAVTYGTAVGATYDPRATADLAWADAELDGYVLNPEFPLDPKRNYPTDYVANPLPGYEPSPPTPEEVATCEQGVELFGFEILPGPGIDPDFQVLSRRPLPVGKRVPHDMIWHFSPFNLKRTFVGNAGRDLMVSTDLTAPYWIGRYFGVLDAVGSGTALAWRDTGVSCGR